MVGFRFYGLSVLSVCLVCWDIMSFLISFYFSTHCAASFMLGLLAGWLDWIWLGSLAEGYVLVMTHGWDARVGFYFHDAYWL